MIRSLEVPEEAFVAWLVGVGFGLWCCWWLREVITSGAPTADSYYCIDVLRNRVDGLCWREERLFEFLLLWTILVSPTVAEGTTADVKPAIDRSSQGSERSSPIITVVGTVIPETGGGAETSGNLSIGMRQRSGDSSRWSRKRLSAVIVPGGSWNWNFESVHPL